MEATHLRIPLTQAPGTAHGLAVQPPELWLFPGDDKNSRIWSPDREIKGIIIAILYAVERTNIRSSFFHTKMSNKFVC